ncbi:uncharacterized protein LOC108099237 [Drosophila ficusphila]|uniref:uncharacterized protein LOC108099237 n=1 Tax=Drosophila ficusphila TaxID=30025 RepID=UPI001C894489|nr:uncharacterized protein LOC108099237 [Drosophila ficusphila]
MDQLVDISTSVKKITTVFMLQKSGANCTIEDWRPQGITTIRSNGLNSFKLRKYFRVTELLAVVCISQDSDVKLLNSLALFYEYVRQERIILWMQVKATEAILKEVARMAEMHSFLRLVVFEMGNFKNGTSNVYHLKPFPKPHFQRVGNISDFKGVFIDPSLNFQGKTATLIQKPGSLVHYNVCYEAMGCFPVMTEEDKQVLEFARKTNLSLRLSLGNIRDLIAENYDLQMSPGLVSTQDAKKSANSFTIASVIVVVPCGKQRSLRDVLRQLDFKKCALFVLPVYIAFVVVEGLMRVVTLRMSGQTHLQPFLRSLINLRAIGAILGHSIAIQSRWNFSRRQLFLALSVFGFVFSNFFACKLSALLTKHSRLAQIQNFEELRASGLPVLIDEELLNFIKKELEENFIEKHIPNVVGVTRKFKDEMIIQFNDSFAYVFYKEEFYILDKYQKHLGHKVFCESCNLTIVSNLPKMFYLKRNSLYMKPLRKFVQKVQESGINLHWKREFLYMAEKHLNISRNRGITREGRLSFGDFEWLWFLLLCGYGIASLVFLIEVTVGGN